MSIYLKKLFKFIIKKIAFIKRLNFKINDKLSVVSSNCSGGIFYKNHKSQFNSPFINSYLYPGDFLELVKNFKKINLYKLKFISYTDSKFFGKMSISSYNTYPIALLGDSNIEVHFMHDRDLEKIQKDWCRRLRRLNYDKLVFILDDRRCISNDEIQIINAMKKSNLFFFTHIKNSKIYNSIYIHSDANYLEWDWINYLEYYVKKGRFNEIFR